jgi:hypothetical protein
LDRVEGRIGLEKEAYGRLARGIWTTKPLLFWLRSVSFVIRAEVADEYKGIGITGLERSDYNWEGSDLSSPRG